jgi:hypothetical protein
MFAFLRNVKKAADFFSIHPDGLSFVTERRLKDVEASVSKWPRVIEDGTFTRIINLEYDLYKLERTIQIIQEKLDKEQVPAQLVLSAEQTETIKKPKPLKLQNVEEEVKKVKSPLTQAKVKRLLEYRDGELYWKVDRLRAKKGDKAGTTKGYKIVFIEGQHYTFGHVIFLMFHGYVPERVSFVDGDYRNTRIENLRAATMSQVSGSAKKSKANTCGYKGITFLKKRNKYVAQINKLGKHYHLGTFNTPQEAYKVYCKAAKKLHGEFARVA